MNEPIPGTEPGAESGDGSGGGTVDDWPTLRERIETAARTAHDHRVAYETELERRDQLVLTAFDHHLAPPAEIADAARLSVTQVYRICSV